MADPSRVVGGYKATISNPNTSDEAKEHAKEMLETEYADVKTGDDKEKDPSRVIGGLKATISNPHTSDEAKEGAKERLEEMPDTTHEANKDPENVARGLKATLSNASVSDEAKENAEARLEEMSGASTTEETAGTTSDESGKNPANVARGLKAAISNPNNSEEAKEYAKQKLEEMGQ